MSSPPVTRRAVVELLKKYDVKAHKILDLGCGDGSFTIEIAKYIGSSIVVGVDISDHALNKAKEKGIDVVKVDLESGSLPFRDNCFDLALAIEVVEHLKTVDDLLLETYRILKRGGLFIVSTPNLGSWINRLLLLLGYQPMHTEPSRKYHVGLSFKRIVKKKKSYASHVNLMTFKALKDLLKLYGFTIVAARGIHWHIRYKILSCIDSLLSNVPSLAQDIVLLARKE